MSAKTRALLEATCLAVFFGLVAIYACRPIWDIDVFWHIVTGRVVAETGSLPTTDRFSAIDPTRPWFTMEWLYAVWVFELDRLGGLQLVRFAHAAVQWSAIVLFWHGCRRRLGFSAEAALALTALLVVLYADRFRERPHVFNLWCWCLLFPWLARGPAALSRTAIVVTALTVALWANVHAGGAFVFLVAAACLPAAALGERLVGVPEAPAHLRRALLWYAAALGPALLAPHFARSLLHLGDVLGAVSEFVPEWRATWHYLVVGTIPGHFVAGLYPSLLGLALAFPAASLLSRLISKHNVAALAADWGLHRLLLTLAMVVLAHRALRFVEHAAFGTVFLLPVLGRLLAERGARAPSPRWVAVAAAVLVAVGVHSRIFHLYGGFPRAIATAFGARPLKDGTYPERLADFLVETGFTGGIFTQPKWGGYLLYRLWPNATVSSDGRLTFAEPAMLDHWKVVNPKNLGDAANGPEFEAIYGRYPGVDLVVGRHPVWPGDYRPDPRAFAPVHANEEGAIWVRATERGTRYLRGLAERSR